MNPFVAFLASPAGRVARVVVGAALIAWGLLGIKGTAGTVVAVIGAVPLLAGVFDVCLVAALFGLPFRGAKIRASNR